VDASPVGTQNYCFFSVLGVPQRALARHLTGNHTCGAHVFEACLRNREGGRRFGGTRGRSSTAGSSLSIGASVFFFLRFFQLMNHRGYPNGWPWR